MVENTRVYEIFRRVLEEYAYGERLGVPSDEGQRWLRTTEQLFYRDNPPFQIYTLASWIRPDIRAVRRNAYHRLFGIDLNHGTDDNRPYPYPRAAAANTEFSATFEELLREVWRAIENVRNQVGDQPDRRHDDRQPGARAVRHAPRAPSGARRKPRARRAVPRVDDGLAASDAELQHADRARPQGRRELSGRATAEDRRARRPARAQSLRQLLPTGDQHVAAPSRDGARARSTIRSAVHRPCSRRACSRPRCRRPSRTGRSPRVAT